MSSSDKRHLHACWGRLAAEILVQNWDEALDDVEKLKDAIDCQSDDRVSLLFMFVQTYSFVSCTKKLSSTIGFYILLLFF